MQKPTADEVYKMMKDAIGEEYMSPAVKHAASSGVIGASEVLLDYMSKRR